jgi:hypothetical protein
MMRKAGIVLACLALVGVALTWKEMPAMRRYIKISRM